jgi:tagatose-1,6-bisphosphate aldolase
MDRLGNPLRAIAFLMSTVISAGILSGFAVWAASTLDPTTQEVIGLASSPPWLTTAGQPKLTRTEAGSVVDRGDRSRTAGASVARHP